MAGGGKVGSFLARKLTEKGNAVAVIEKNERTCRELASSLDIMVVHGDACDFRFQEEAQVDRADVFAAVTGDDDDNLVACQLARVSFNVPRTVARVNNPKNERIFQMMGIDAISSTSVISELIERKTSLGEIITLYTMKKGNLAIVEVDIPEEGSDACCKPVRELGLPKGCVLVTVVRDDEVLIPHGDDVLRPGDSVIAVTSLDKEEYLKKILTSRS
ncbi:MAG: NAD-binding protein [Candidatus Geothermincolales bacterium]